MFWKIKGTFKGNDGYYLKNDNDTETNFEMKMNQDFNIQLSVLRNVNEKSMKYSRKNNVLNKKD